MTSMSNNVSGVLNNAANTVQQATTQIDNTNYIFYIIIIVLLLSIVGINLFLILGNITEETIEQSSPFFKWVYGTLGYSVGNTIKQTAIVSGEGAKLGIDVASGTIASGVNALQKLGSTDDMYEHRIQRDIEKLEKNLTNSSVGSYCYVGTYDGKRTCASINDSTKCMSGDIFNSLDKCKKKV